MRLLPRFSLRFAWIALTIFLIGFALTTNFYQRYQAHERIATQLQNVSCDVEEESIRWLGFEIGKRLRGIQVNGQPDMAYLTLFQELPRPQELRRFGLSETIIHQKGIAQLLAGVETYPELEELYLQNVTFTREQAELLERMPQLRVLDLSHCNLPTGALALLAKSPQLETLILNGVIGEVSELLTLDLPRLRNLDIRCSRCRCLGSNRP